MVVNVVKTVTRIGYAEVNTYKAEPKACPVERGVCAMYDAERNFYVCGYCGEEIKVNGVSDVGLATSECTHPAIN